MPHQPRHLRVVFHTVPDAAPEGPRHDILDLIAQGLATRGLAEARAEAEAALGRPLKHATEPVTQHDPVEAMKRRVLRST